MYYYWKEEKEEKEEEKKVPFPVTESILPQTILPIERESGDDE